MTMITFIRTAKSIYFTVKYEFIAFFHSYRQLELIYFTSKVNVRYTSKPGF